MLLVCKEFMSVHLYKEKRGWPTQSECTKDVYMYMHCLHGIFASSCVKRCKNSCSNSSDSDLLQGDDGSDASTKL